MSKEVEKEIWKNLPIEHFEDYLISSKGNVRHSKKTGLISRIKKNNKLSNSLTIERTTNGKRKKIHILLPKLVKEMFGLDIFINKEYEDLEGEIWKPVVDSEDYLVSNKGRVLSLNYRGEINRRKVLKPTLSKYGYYKVGIKFKTKKLPQRLHRLVAKAFLPNPNNYAQVNHIDGNPSNNNVENLEWCDASHNVRHAYDTGLNGTQREVLKICKATNKILKEYESVIKAAKDVGLLNSSPICNAISKNRTSKGFKWRYKFLNEGRSKVLKVNKICIETKKILQTYNSVSEAARENSVASASLSSACKKIYHTSAGFEWEYAKEEELTETPKTNVQLSLF